MTNKEKLRKIKAEMEKYKWEYNRYVKLSKRAEELENRMERDKRIKSYISLCEKTKFEAPLLPSMGVRAEEGSAEFCTYEDAKALLAELRYFGGYETAYELEWDGPGNYKTKTEWKYDHDKDIIYTIYIRKEK